MSDQLAKYKLHICNDTLFIYNFIAKMPPFYPTNLVFKRNLRNLNNKDHSLSQINDEVSVRLINCLGLKWGDLGNSISELYNRFGQVAINKWHKGETISKLPLLNSKMTQSIGSSKPRDRKGSSIFQMVHCIIVIILFL